MRWSLSSPFKRASRQIREDLAADPYLKYILLVSAVLVSFWLWHRIPNFATRDERWRVVDSMEVVGFLENDFSFESLQQGTKYWRSFGATMYLYGLVSLPMFAVAYATDQMGVFGDIPGSLTVDFFAHWQNVPAWMWWATILPARMVNAALAVGCVYLIYRIGTRLRDRATGRLAAILLALTWGLVFLAHEAGEDVPMLFCLLVVLYFAVSYIETGKPHQFYWGCVAGGIALAFKLTAGVGAIVLGVAYLLRVRRSEDFWYAAAPVKVAAVVGVVGGILAAAFVLLGPFAAAATALGLLVVLAWPRSADQYGPRDAVSSRTGARGWLAERAPVAWARHPDASLSHYGLLVAGPALALVLLFLGFPSAVFNGPGVVLERVGRGVATKAVSHGWLDRPNWWWFLRGSLNGLGWPLFVACLGAIGVSLTRLRERSLERDGVVLALVGIGIVVAIFSTWEYFRTHHLLPTFPLAILLVAVSLRRLEVRRETAARVLTAGLLVSTAIYTGIGTVGYATQSRDQAVHWLERNGGPNATVETYSYDSQEAAVPHGFTIYRPTNRPGGTLTEDPLGEWMQAIEQRCPDYVVLNYQRSMIWLAPDDHSALAARWSRPDAAEFLYDLLTTNETYLTENAPYPYEVAQRFGREPFFLDDDTPIDQTWNAVRAGIFPRTIQYGDPQDFGVYGYAVVLERSGQCEA